MTKKLSACLIVRDEEENLEACLSSIRGHVDEIICVDTGSEDRTREVAVRHGANVYQFDWRSHPASFFQDTEEECRKFGAPGAYSGMWCLADFAGARNESFKHATGDYIVWIDADDVLIGAENLRHVVNHLHTTNLPIGYLAYNYASDHLGRVTYRQWRERVMRKGVGDWINPVHEVFMPKVPMSGPSQYDTPVYEHRRKADRKQVPHRNYKILLRQVWQMKGSDPSAVIDPRILFYLGQESQYVEPHKAVGFYEEYLQRSGWSEERAAAHIALAGILERGALEMPVGNRLAQAEREYAAAQLEMPDSPDGFFGAARIAHMRERWWDCVRYSDYGFKIGNPDSMLGTKPMERIYAPHVYYNYALSKLGLIEQALTSCKAALAAMPDDPGIQGGSSGMLSLNMRVYEDQIAQAALAAAQAAKEAKVNPPEAQGLKLQATLNINENVDDPPNPYVGDDVVVLGAREAWKRLVAVGDGDRAKAFIDSLPESIKAHSVVQRMVESTSRRFGSMTVKQVHGGERVTYEPPKPAGPPSYRGVLEGPRGNGGMRDVVLYIGAGPEPWDPNTPNAKGLGGSETAAVEVAKNLAQLGHHVVVYAEASGTFDGVEYRHHSSFRGANCDVFIASRMPHAVEVFGPVVARIKLLWVHDIGVGTASGDLERWLLLYDRVLCLSEWHKRFVLGCYPTLHADRVIVTRNGIDPVRFTPIINGAPQTGMPQKTNSLVFSSSPNRGLDWLVSNFRMAIKPAVPDAELHIFYGFDTWETMARASGAQDQLALIQQFKSILPPLGANEGGIFNHGKRPQNELAAAQLRAKVWPYLTAFEETSCITAMESMAAGAVPVCSRVAALPETVKHGIFVDNENKDVAQVWCDHVIRLLKNDHEREQIAVAGRAYALTSLSWAMLARDWSAMFDRLEAEVGADPIPLWRSA